MIVAGRKSGTDTSKVGPPVLLCFSKSEVTFEVQPYKVYILCQWRDSCTELQPQSTDFNWLAALRKPLSAQNQISKYWLYVPFMAYNSKITKIALVYNRNLLILFL